MDKQAYEHIVGACIHKEAAPRWIRNLGSWSGKKLRSLLTDTSDMPDQLQDMVRNQGLDPSDFYIQAKKVAGDPIVDDIPGDTMMIRAGNPGIDGWSPSSRAGAIDTVDTFWSPPADHSIALDWYNRADRRPLMAADIRKAPLVRIPGDSYYTLAQNNFLRRFPRIRRALIDSAHRRGYPLTTLDRPLTVYKKTHPVLYQYYYNNGGSADWAIDPKDRLLLHDIQSKIPYTGDNGVGMLNEPPIWKKDIFGRPVGSGVQSSARHEITRVPEPGNDVVHIVTPKTGLPSPNGVSPSIQYLLTRRGNLGRNIKLNPGTDYISTGIKNNPYWVKFTHGLSSILPD